MTANRNRVEKSAKAFRSIGEAAAELGLETHVLRYWESKFPRDVKPVKRADGRRLFRPRDIDALRAIQILVHERGLTLKGAKALLADQGLQAVLSGAATLGNGTVASPARELQRSVAKAFNAEISAEIAPERQGRLEGALVGLTDLKARLDAMRDKRAA
jgi:DNA-binding transcriptional MerR regulator